MDPSERKKLGEKARAYVKDEFSYKATIDRWHETLNDTIDNWKNCYKPWKKVTV